MDRETRLKRLFFRAWHRGTKEADLLIGGYFDRYSAHWSAEHIEWFEVLLDEEDVEIMAWAIGTMPVPDRYQGPMMEAMKTLDYIPIPK
jgi:antitoxin CptB